MSPAADFESPVIREMSPLLTSVELPVAIVISPVMALVESPEEMDTAPEAPLEEDERMATEPVEPVTDRPEETIASPPTVSDPSVSPPVSCIAPPLA
jgi:hypothetical protein